MNEALNLNLSGPLAKSFSFDVGGGDIQGTSFGGELAVITSGEFSSASNNGSGIGSGEHGFGYDFNNPENIGKECKPLLIKLEDLLTPKTDKP